MQDVPYCFDFASHDAHGIKSLLERYNLRLTVDEALAIQNDLLKRPPTYAECVLWSIQGSEHCSYKSTRLHLKQFISQAPQVILGPSEDAGIVAVATDAQGVRYGIVVSHESHNHPSQLVPYEGAATGVGGNVRDVCCMGAEVIAVADSLRFGDIQRAKTKWLHRGVVQGIAGYGNPLGLPNIAGDVYYDAAYNDNCLVTLVTLGIVREDHIIHSYAPPEAKDYRFILVGKPTDNSGFGGAAFASSNLNEQQAEENKGAVQEPNAFLQRHLLKANYALFELLREKQLINQVGFKDLGAGGIACAAVELADAGGYGAELELHQVPTSMDNLHPAVILCSETQERFMWVVPESLVDTILIHYNQRFALPEISEGARAAVVGKIRHDGLFVVNYHHDNLVSAKAEDITRGIVYNRPYAAKAQNLSEPQLASNSNANQLLLNMLAHENIASRAPVFECYDKQVQGRSHLEPGWADAGVITPFNEEKYPTEIRRTAVALSMDHNPRYNKIDAYWGAVNAVFEAVRNVVAVGAWPLAITDCLCFGNPENPEQMGEFVDAVRGIREACQAVKTDGEVLPVISGNVSLYNESAQGAIPPSPIISCIAAMLDVTKALSYDFKQSDSCIIMIGSRQDECGGSLYYQLQGCLGSQLPKPDLNRFIHDISAVHAASQADLLLAAHDISDGGVAVALAEMSFKRAIGVDVMIVGNLANEKKLFSETGGFIIEVASQHVEQVKQLLTQHQADWQIIGKTTAHAQLNMNNYISLSVSDARQAWTNGLREKLIA